MTDDNEDRARTAAAQVFRFGCLPLVIGMMLLASLGFCGECAQKHVIDGITKIHEATK